MQKNTSQENKDQAQQSVCSLCDKIQDNLIITECGHSFCKRCIICKKETKIKDIIENEETTNKSKVPCGEEKLEKEKKEESSLEDTIQIEKKEEVIAEETELTPIEEKKLYRKMEEKPLQIETKKETTAEEMEEIPIEEIKKTSNDESISYNPCPCYPFGESAKSIVWLINEARKGNAEAQLNLAMCYMHGIKTKKNENEGKRWIFEACNQKNLFSIGYSFYKGWVEHKNKFEEAFECFNLAYKEGKNVWAMYYIGKCYFEGHGVPKDIQKAMEWFKKAAAHNCPLATNAIGNCYKDGIGVDKDEKEAFHWYMKGGNEQYSSSLHNVGFCFENGIGVEKNLEKALLFYKFEKDPKLMEENELAKEIKKIEDEIIEYSYYPFGKYAKDISKLKKAADRINVDAYVNLGMCYIHGIKTEKDEYFGKSCIIEAARKGNAFSIGYCYYRGFEEYKLDYNEAFIYFLHSLRTERNIWAMYYIGLCYLEGHGVPQDEQKAIEWFKKAAEYECPLAINAIGECYENGRGVNRNVEKAFDWYMKGEGLDCSLLLYNIGRSFHHGIGTRQDLTAALGFYNRARELGHKYMEDPYT